MRRVDGAKVDGGRGCATADSAVGLNLAIYPKHNEIVFAPWRSTGHNDSIVTKGLGAK